ncbi:Ferric iron ABC transporter, iron-binding protein [Methylophaga thiooxydans]|uniref:Ferric iron ABC transporter, iron-binding protein n=1 Tax=Methylophaga thiooxydans TaxID=392484 RepID=A0A0A0BHY4_9GAMM|nr:Fe(3+) ABC transporter substrate-binding protein [Methylophaga thiooxydans]KGM07257.1 Ferric iron ABC transporter, iron-binding protein [Methylophaga thiooxydans]
MKPFKSFFTLIPALLGLGMTPAISQAAEEVNLYSARMESLIKPLLDQFTQDTGIKVNVVSGKADELLQRLKLEGRNSPADMLLTTDAGRLHRALEAELLQTVSSDILNERVPSSYRDPEGHWYGLSLRARPIMYAVDRVNPEQLSTYEQLASDEWDNKICIRSSSNIYNQSLVASMIAADGEDTTQAWAENLVANFARPPQGGDRDQIKAVAAGQCDIAVANTYYLAGMHYSQDESERQAAEKVAVFWPNQADRGTHINISGAAVTAAAKNRDNAIKLLEFLTSDAAQRWYGMVNGEYPVREGIEMNDTLASWGEFKSDDLNMRQLGELNATALRLMDKAGWR